MLPERRFTTSDLPFPLDKPLYGRNLVPLVAQFFQPVWSEVCAAARLDVATVTDIQHPAKTVTADMGGEEVTARYPKGYTPAVGDEVLVVYTSRLAVALTSLA